MGKTVQMKTKLFKAIVLVGLLGPISAYATILYSASATIFAFTGPDTLGLSGASFTLNATWDSAAVYVDRFGTPAADALTHSFHISGASVGASNGPWTDPQGLAFSPTSFGQFFGGGPAGGHSEFVVNGTALQMWFLVEKTVGAFVGGPISPAHFGTNMEFILAPLYFSNIDDGSSYAMLEFLAGVSESNGGSVPEPTAIMLLGIGLAGLGFAKRRLP